MKFAAYCNPKKLEEKNLHGFSDHICIKFRIRKTWKEKKSTQISEKICRKFLPPKFVPPNLKSEKFWQPGTGLWSGAGSSPGSGAEVDCAYSTIYWIPFMQNILQLATIFFRQLHKQITFHSGKINSKKSDNFFLRKKYYSVSMNDFIHKLSYLDKTSNYYTFLSSSEKVKRSSDII